MLPIVIVVVGFALLALKSASSVKPTPTPAPKHRPTPEEIPQTAGADEPALKTVKDITEGAGAVLAIGSAGYKIAQTLGIVGSGSKLATGTGGVATGGNVVSGSTTATVTALEIENTAQLAAAQWTSAELMGAGFVLGPFVVYAIIAGALSIMQSSMQASDEFHNYFNRGCAPFDGSDALILGTHGLNGGQAGGSWSLFDLYINEIYAVNEFIARRQLNVTREEFTDDRIWFRTRKINQTYADVTKTPRVKITPEFGGSLKYDSSGNPVKDSSGRYIYASQAAKGQIAEAEWRMFLKCLRHYTVRYMYWRHLYCQSVRFHWWNESNFPSGATANWTAEKERMLWNWVTVDESVLWPDNTYTVPYSETLERNAKGKGILYALAGVKYDSNFYAFTDWDSDRYTREHVARIGAYKEGFVSPTVTPATAISAANYITSMQLINVSGGLCRLDGSYFHWIDESQPKESDKYDRTMVVNLPALKDGKQGAVYFE